MRLADRVAIVTGAGSGIGHEIARRFGTEGAQVIVADIALDSARRTASQITDPPADAVAVDVTDRDGVRRMADGVLTTHGKIDVLVNNAGVCTGGDVLDITDEQWDRDVDVCLKGTFHCARAVLSTMIDQAGGVIVNISSVNAVSYFGNDAYSAAKAGILSLTRSIAVNHGQHGIRCNAIVPGSIRTPVWDERLRRDPDRIDRVSKWYPLGRVGSPQDVANAAIFLASDEAAWISGITLPVDGGLLAGNLSMTDELLDR